MTIVDKTINIMTITNMTITNKTINYMTIIIMTITKMTITNMTTTITNMITNTRCFYTVNKQLEVACIKFQPVTADLKSFKEDDIQNVFAFIYFFRTLAPQYNPSNPMLIYMFDLR